MSGIIQHRNKMDIYRGFIIIVLIIIDNPVTYADGENATLGCEEGYFDELCSSQCNSGCRNRRCTEHGNCTEGCIDGYWGDTCSKVCSSLCVKCDRHNGIQCAECNMFHYGDSCTTSCRHKCPQLGCDNDGNCRSCSVYCKCSDHDTQNCIGKCFKSNNTCINGCKVGYYGQKCDRTCVPNCVNNICDGKSGYCTEGCKIDFYGDFCVYKCGNCVAGLCHQVTGICSVGCKNGFYGTRCETKCAENCYLNRCNKETGFCVLDVVSVTTESPSIPENSSAVYGTVVSVGVVLGCTIAGLLIFRFCKTWLLEKRRQNTHPVEETQIRTLPDLPGNTDSDGYYVINEDDVFRGIDSQDVPGCHILETRPTSDLSIDPFSTQTNAENDEGEFVGAINLHVETTRNLMSDKDLISKVENSVYGKGIEGKHVMKHGSTGMSIPKQYLTPDNENESHF